MAAYHAEYPCDLAKPSQVISIPHVFATGDNESHTFTALVYDSDNPRCGLMAGSVSGVVVTPAGGTVPLLGTKESEVREITLPSGQTAQATACSITLIQGCFAYAGQIVIVIRLVDGDAQTAVLIARGTVTRSLTETIVDPGEVVSDISTLVANAEQAAEDAQTALAQASGIVSYAEQTGQTDAEKAQARSNIGAMGADDLTVARTVVLTWQQGNVGSTTGNDNASSDTTVIRTPQPKISVDFDTIFSYTVPEGLKLSVWARADGVNGYILTGATGSGTFRLAAGDLYRLVMQSTTTGADVAPSEGDALVLTAAEDMAQRITDLEARVAALEAQLGVSTLMSAATEATGEE